MKQITARVSQRILNKVDRLFDGNPSTIFAELLQNSRRAGATRVDITIRHTDATTFVAFADDGQGIHNPWEMRNADPDKSFLTLGGSDWSDPTEANEDPAGMGVFSLCAASTSGVEIYSRAWSAQIPKEAFLGQTPVTIRDETPMRGTKVMFHLPRLLQAKLLLEGLILHGPTDCFIGGVRVPREDFLKKHILVKEIPDLGVRIGVTTYGCYDEHRAYNFFGLGLKTSGARRIAGLRCSVDVLNCRHIKLVHPARNAVVAGPDLLRLDRECDIAMFEAVKATGAHSLAFDEYQEARALGVDLPEADAKLQPWEPSDHAAALYIDTTAINPEGGMLVEVDDCGPAHSLWRAAACNPKALPRLFDPSCRMRGYSWYDRLQVLEDVDPLIDGAKTHWKWGVKKTAKGVEHVYLPTVQKSLGVRAHIRGRKKPVDLTTDILLPEGDQCSYWESHNWLVAAGHGFTRNRSPLQELLTAAYFDYNEDRDSDGQLEEFKTGRDTAITEELRGQKAALQNTLDEFLNSYKFGGTANVKAIRIAVVPPSPSEIAECKKRKVDRRYWPTPSFKSYITLCKK